MAPISPSPSWWEHDYYALIGCLVVVALMYGIIVSKRKHDAAYRSLTGVHKKDDDASGGEKSNQEEEISPWSHDEGP